MSRPHSHVGARAPIHPSCRQRECTFRGSLARLPRPQPGRVASAVKDERVYLGHIRDAVNDIEQYTSVGRDAFVAERMRHDAVIRKLEIIGEAVKQLSDATKDRRPEIPWKQLACAI